MAQFTRLQRNDARRMSRRRFLSGRIMSVIGASMAAQVTGCLSTTSISQPDLVWGRRGFSDGRFLKPRAMAIGPNDELYIVDTTGRIQVFGEDGEFLRNWKTPETANGRPTGLAIGRSSKDPSKLRLLVADTHYYRMLVYSLHGELVASEQIGGTAGHRPGEFAFVTDAVTDDQGHFFIGEYGDSDRIQKFDADGNFVMQWGGTGHELGKFVRPQSLVMHDGLLWVADACNHRFQVFQIGDDSAKLVHQFGSEGSAPGEFYYPYDFAFANDGTLVVCEYGNQRLQRLTPEGKSIATWGQPGFASGQLNQPWGVCIDSKNRIHVLDSNNHRVQRIKMFGV